MVGYKYEHGSESNQTLYCRFVWIGSEAKNKKRYRYCFMWVYICRFTLDLRTLYHGFHILSKVTIAFVYPVHVISKCLQHLPNAKCQYLMPVTHNDNIQSIKFPKMSFKFLKLFKPQTIYDRKLSEQIIFTYIICMEEYWWSTVFLTICNYSFFQMSQT